MLSIIAGKPGSGKSYHMATILVDMLTDWVRFEIKNGEPFDSTIWTNIVFRIDGLNETIGKRVGKEVDVSKYMNFCDAEFFQDSENIYWWKKFPAKSVIIIDEVHFYLGKRVEYGSLDLEQELINWISTHRHSQQEIYFLSQHTDQFANQVLGIADKLLEVVNLKSLDLPSPISVSMTDIDELKRSFGIKTQYYQANVGNFRGKAIRWSKAVQRHMMTADIYRVYKSHDAGVEESDRPSLQMTPFEAIIWFGKKHAWHLVPKFVGILSLPFLVGGLLMWLPTFLSSSLFGSSVATKTEAISKESEVVVGSPDRPSLLAVDIPPTVAAVAQQSSRVLPTEVPKVTKEEILKPILRSMKVVMLYQKGVMLDDGRKVSVGESFVYEGETETLSVACAVCGVMAFESGKRVRF